MFVALLLLCPVGIAALFAFSLFADKVFHDARLPKPPALLVPQVPRRLKVRRR
ncbi:hypothetical protein [Caballeronia sp. LZ016]|uniref:hypothetical protein n=1 Tax=Caballeronia sp. LZ016 TaxID=3038554 RepID=UPI00285ED676|nr:hypothetical protein [Caballeronia sp. LZ016]MDR5739662.1 hypothetical protein [Caballeronia sp. LZ016]